MSSPAQILPLSAAAKPAKNHAILVATGFLILIPIGVLTARYLRTFNRHWVNAHMIINFLIAGPILLGGIGTGIRYTQSINTGGNWVDPHKKTGLSLLILYCVQVILGLTIHFFKMPRFMGGRRPPQNYFHVALGLIILAIAFEQVHYGIYIEWAEGTGGNPPVPNSAKRAWLAWVIVFWVVYFAGYGLLPRQFRQERLARERADAKRENVPLTQVDHTKGASNGTGAA